MTPGGREDFHIYRNAALQAPLRVSLDPSAAANKVQITCHEKLITLEDSHSTIWPAVYIANSAGFLIWILLLIVNKFLRKSRRTFTSRHTQEIA